MRRLVGQLIALHSHGYPRAYAIDPISARSGMVQPTSPAAAHQEAVPSWGAPRAAARQLAGRARGRVHGTAAVPDADLTPASESCRRLPYCLGRRCRRPSA